MELPLRRVINSREARKLGIDTDKLDCVFDSYTPSEKSISLQLVRVRLRQKIEMQRKKANADLAVIYDREDIPHVFVSEISYSYRLYRQKSS